MLVVADPTSFLERARAKNAFVPLDCRAIAIATVTGVAKPAPLRPLTVTRLGVHLISPSFPEQGDSAEDQPQNDPERQRIAAQEGQIPPEDFIRTLLDSGVFMPIYEQHQIGRFAANSKTQPLKNQTEDREDVLVLFTRPNRAKQFVRDFPGCDGGLVTELTWILEKLGIGYGITLNPDQVYGMDFEPRT